MFGNPSQRVDRLTRELQHLGNREVSQFARGLPRIQQQSKIGRRNARRNRGRLFLHIVGNQPVVLLSAELREIAPGANCGATEEEFVFFRRFIA